MRRRPRPELREAMSMVDEFVDSIKPPNNMEDLCVALILLGWICKKLDINELEEMLPALIQAVPYWADITGQ